MSESQPLDHQSLQDPEKGAAAENDTTPLVRSTGPPPSYESLYGRVKAARSESSGFFSFLKAATLIVISTVGFTLLIGLFMAVPIAMIAIGAYYLNDCPAERYIPIYLIVGGCFAYFRMVLSIGLKVKQRCCGRESDEDREEEVNQCHTLLDCFQLAWFIAGNVWVYRTYDHFNSTDSSASNFCDPTLYYFAFWLTTSVYILLVVGCCFVGLCGVCVSLFS